MNRAHTPANAYVPFFAQLVRALQDHCGAGDLDNVMGAVGRRLAAEGHFDRGDFVKRIEGAAALLEDLGGPCTVQALKGGFVVSGNGSCMLVEAVQGRPEVCRAMKSVMAELVQAPVQECCERGEDAARCCFEIRLVMEDALEQRANPIADPSTERLRRGLA